MSTVIDAIRHKTFDLKIETENKEIVLMGYPAEAAGKVLRGKVILTLEEPMKLRAVTLNFLGKMKVAWSEGIGHHQHYHKQEKDILEHKWQFVPVMDQHPKKSYTLNQGRHEWDFELSLPGTLPQTLEAEGGQISYRLKAVVERSVLLQNIVKKQPVRIVRCLLPSAFDLAQSLEIHNTWSEKMMYDILLPSKLYTRGQLIPVTFHITPIAAGLRVRSLTASLKEYCTYTAHDCSKTDTRIIKLHKDEDPFPNAPLRLDSTLSSSSNNDIHQNRHSATSSNSHDNASDGGPITWTKVIQLDIPPMSSQAAFCDADNDLIRIRHKMKFVICLANADGHLSELRCSVPLIIVSSVSSENEAELSTSLPAYDQSWRTVLCMEGPPAPQQQNLHEQYEVTSSNGSVEQPSSQPQLISRPQSALSSSAAQQHPRHEQPYARRAESDDRWTSNHHCNQSSNSAASAATAVVNTTNATQHSFIPNPISTGAAIRPAHIPITSTAASRSTTANTTPNTSSTNLSMSPLPSNTATSPPLSSSPAPSVWWHGTNLSRVPSYRTAAQQEQATFSSSLPTYEQITSALQAMTTTTSTATSNDHASNNNNNNSSFESTAMTHTSTTTTAAVPVTSNHMADNDIIYKRD